MNRNRYPWNLICGLLMGLLGAYCGSAEILVEDPNMPGNSKAIRGKIIESQIQPLYLSITTVTQTDLDDLISSLDSLEVPAAQKRPPQESQSAPQSPDSVSQEKTELPPESVEQKTEEEPIPPARPQQKDPVTGMEMPEWIKKIDQVDRPIDPMALGDMLYHIGQIERAERFYQQALETAASPENPDWQWAMYQRANCLRRKNYDQAQKLYKELIQKAPSSSWSAAADAQQSTLAWYASMKTSNLQRFLSDPNSLQ